MKPFTMLNCEICGSLEFVQLSKRDERENVLNIISIFFLFRKLTFLPIKNNTID